MLRGFTFIFILISFGTSWGQESSTQIGEIPAAEAGAETTTKLPDSQPDSAESKQVEKVEVTGSHIKRIEAEGASPVQVINRKELEKTGYNSVSDVLRDTTSNSFGSMREDSGSNAAGTAHVDLRGLGASSTLVLLNGQRLPTDAVTGAVDLNLIPMAAIERVEVLKDGASAIYGSDALGGVVNIITRQDFSGSEASYTQTVPEAVGGTKKEFSLVNGINKGRLNMVNVLNYRNNEVIYSRDRKWSNNVLSPTGSPGSYRNAGGQWIADASCPADLQLTTGAGTVCQFQTADYSTELPALEQFGLLSETNYEVNSRVKVKARLGGTSRNVKWSYAPAPGTFTIPGAVADGLGAGGTPLPGATPGEDLQVRYRLTDLGTRDANVDTTAYNLLLGTTVDVGGNWELSVNGSHNRVESKDEGVNGYALTQKLNDAISSGQFNPFAPEGQRGSLAGVRYNPIEKTTSEISSLDIKMAGEVAELESGPVGLAVGTVVTGQKFADVFDEQSVAGEVFGNAGSSGGGQRDTQAAYTEVSIPVTSKTEVQLAARYDHYSDFGDTANPKAAVVYRPSKSWLVRASAGTGFKAPLMQDLYAATGLGYPTFVDHVACKAEQQAGGATPSCAPAQYEVTSSGNKGLKEERSTSWNIGTIFEPNNNFSIGTDFFVTNMNNVVSIDYDDMTRAEAAGIDLASRGVIVKRDANGYIESIEAPMQNLAAREVSGVDLSTAVRISKVKLSMGHSHLLYFKEQGFPGTPLRDKLGENGRPEWRNTVGVAYLPNEQHDFEFSALTLSGHEKSVKEEGNLPSYTTLDFQYAFKSKNWGTITAGIKNVLGSTPPLDDSNPTQPMDYTLYDQIGRQFYSGYKATF